MGFWKIYFITNSFVSTFTSQDRSCATRSARDTGNLSTALAIQNTPTQGEKTLVITAIMNPGSHACGAEERNAGTPVHDWLTMRT